MDPLAIQELRSRTFFEGVNLIPHLPINSIRYFYSFQVYGSPFPLVFLGLVVIHRHQEKALDRIISPLHDDPNNSTIL